MKKQLLVTVILSAAMATPALAKRGTSLSDYTGGQKKAGERVSSQNKVEQRRLGLEINQAEAQKAEGMPVSDKKYKYLQRRAAQELFTNLKLFSKTEVDILKRNISRESSSKLGDIAMRLHEAKIIKVESQVKQKALDTALDLAQKVAAKIILESSTKSENLPGLTRALNFASRAAEFIRLEESAENKETIERFIKIADKMQETLNSKKPLTAAIEFLNKNTDAKGRLNLAEIRKNCG